MCATVSLPNHTVGTTTPLLCLLAFVLMMYFYEAIAGIIHCIEYLCAHALLLLCGIACKLCDYMACCLCVTIVLIKSDKKITFSLCA